MNTNTANHAVYRDKIRARGHKVNPYRLGFAVGENDDNLPSPYTDPTSTRQYNMGVERGRTYGKIRAKVTP